MGLSSKIRFKKKLNVLYIIFDALYHKDMVSTLKEINACPGVKVFYITEKLKVTYFIYCTTLL